MNATVHSSTDLVMQLVESCRHTQEGFRHASQAVACGDLKRLFGIYSQQRTRFAEELCQYLPAGAAGPAQKTEWSALAPAEIMRRCLDADKSSLDLYGQALASGGMSSRAHFLISAQYSLLQRVHERGLGIFASRSPERD